MTDGLRTIGTVGSNAHVPVASRLEVTVYNTCHNKCKDTHLPSSFNRHLHGCVSAVLPAVHLVQLVSESLEDGVFGVTIYSKTKV